MPIDATLIKRLKENDPTLTELKFNSISTKLDAKDIAELVGVLQNNQTITEFVFNGFPIGSKTFSPLLDVLSKMVKLRTIKLSNCGIDSEGARRLATAIIHNKTLRVLDLEENKIGAKGAQALASFIAKHPTLTELNLYSNKIGDEGVKHLTVGLAGNSTLQRLSLGSNKIGKNGAKSLATFLAQNPPLTHLFIGLNEIGDKGAEALALALESNTKLRECNCSFIRANDKYEDFIKEKLDRNKALLAKGQAFLSKTVDDSDDTEKSALTSRTEEKDTRGRKTDVSQEVPIPIDAALIKRIKENDPTLTELRLNSITVKLGAKDIVELIGALQNNQNITVFEFVGYSLESGTFSQLTDVLSKMMKLRTIKLSDCGIDSDRARYFSVAFIHNTILCEFSLEHNNIGKIGTQALAPFIAKHPALAKLDLSNNQIGDEGVQHLTVELAGNRTLQSLSLRKNEIGTNGTKALAKFLEYNTLTHLDLISNDIGDDGAKALALALERNTTLIWCPLAPFDSLLNPYNVKIFSYIRDKVRQNSRARLAVLSDDTKKSARTHRTEDKETKHQKTDAVISESKSSLFSPDRTKDRRFTTTADTAFHLEQEKNALQLIMSHKIIEGIEAIREEYKNDIMLLQSESTEDQTADLTSALIDLSLYLCQLGELPASDTQARTQLLKKLSHCQAEINKQQEEKPEIIQKMAELYQQKLMQIEKDQSIQLETRLLELEKKQSQLEAKQAPLYAQYETEKQILKTRKKLLQDEGTRACYRAIESNFGARLFTSFMLLTEKIQQSSTKVQLVVKAAASFIPAGAAISGGASLAQDMLRDRRNARVLKHVGSLENAMILAETVARMFTEQNFTEISLKDTEIAVHIGKNAAAKMHRLLKNTAAINLAGTTLEKFLVARLDISDLMSFIDKIKQATSPLASREAKDTVYDPRADKPLISGTLLRGQAAELKELKRQVAETDGKASIAAATREQVHSVTGDIQAFQDSLKRLTTRMLRIEEENADLKKRLAQLEKLPVESSALTRRM